MSWSVRAGGAESGVAAGKRERSGVTRPGTLVIWTGASGAEVGGPQLPKGSASPPPKV